MVILWMTASARACYHSDLKIAYAAGILPPPVRRSIPRSTRARWRDQDFGKLVQMPGVSDVNERLEIVKDVLARPELYKIIRTLIAANRMLRRALYSFKGAKQRLARARAKIVGRAERLSGNLRVLYLRSLNLTSHQIRHWQRSIEACRTSIYGLCPKRHPLQLARREAAQIIAYVRNPDFACWPLMSIFHKMRNDGALYCAPATFYAYCRKLGISRTFRSIKCKIRIGIRAGRPGEILHADVTRFALDGGRIAHIHLLLDNFSRKILAAAASLSPSAALWRSILEGVLLRYTDQLAEPFQLIVDEGSENKGAVIELAEEMPERMKRLVARKDIDFSNSMAEAANKVLKNQYLAGRKFTEIEQLQTALDVDVANYGARPHRQLHGLPPDEAWSGAIPDPHRFAAQMKEARAARVLANQQIDCGACKAGEIEPLTVES